MKLSRCLLGFMCDILICLITTAVRGRESHSHLVGYWRFGIVGRSAVTPQCRYLGMTLENQFLTKSTFKLTALHFRETYCSQCSTLCVWHIQICTQLCNWMSPKPRVAYCSFTLMIELHDVCAEFDTIYCFHIYPLRKSHSIWFWGINKCNFVENQRWTKMIILKFFNVLKHIRRGFLWATSTYHSNGNTVFLHRFEAGAQRKRKL